jgi:hypothetical protein
VSNRTGCPFWGWEQSTRAGRKLYPTTTFLPPTTTCCLPRLLAASHDYLLPPTTTCCLPRLLAASHDYLLPPTTTCSLPRLPAPSHDYLPPSTTTCCQPPVPRCACLEKDLRALECPSHYGEFRHLHILSPAAGQEYSTPAGDAGV